MLHVLVSGTCNNNCLFCMEADRDKRRDLALAQSPDDIRSMIESYPTAHGILFTSGEPTLSAHLITYVRLARERGFGDIALISNGRLLAYPERAAALVRAGVNRITISIHGHEARLHDGLTRTPGSFEQTHAALANLALLKKSHRLRLHSSTVVNQRNLPHLGTIFRSLAASGVDVIVFNVMMAKGRGAEHLLRLMPRYHDVVEAVGELCAELSAVELARLRVQEVPDCIAAQLPAEVRGKLEPFHQFEPVGSTGIPEVDVDAAPSGLEGGPSALRVGGGQVPRAASERLDASHPGEVICAADLGGEREYYLTDRAFKEQLSRVRGEPCAACPRASCLGVWRPYVEEFGWSEFEPPAA